MAYQELEQRIGNFSSPSVSDLREENERLKRTIAELKLKVTPCTKPYSEKMYILLLSYVDSDERDFEIVTGRTAARDIIKTQCLYRDKEAKLDVDASKVLVEGRLPELMTSVYLFCRAVEDKYDDGFDIEDFRVQNSYEGGDNSGHDDDDESSLLLYSNPGKPMTDEQNVYRIGNVLNDITNVNTDYKDI